jgi:hypothetical protein
MRFNFVAIGCMSISGLLPCRVFCVVSSSLTMKGRGSEGGADLLGREERLYSTSSGAQSAVQKTVSRYKKATYFPRAKRYLVGILDKSSRRLIYKR